MNVLVYVLVLVLVLVLDLTPNEGTFRSPRQY
jgi:hypothetical protein